jgi:hypothetical protein
MEKTYKTEFGAFTLDTAHNTKIASKFEAVGYSQIDELKLLLEHVQIMAWS